ncbi:MAG: hypothetical protein HY348_07345 [Nitrospira defluvii]|nr:hypothetical protein [Nitrospira defluvii]
MYNSDYAVGDRVRIIKPYDPFNGRICTVVKADNLLIRLDVPLEPNGPGVQEHAYYCYHVERA